MAFPGIRAYAQTADEERVYVRSLHWAGALAGAAFGCALALTAAGSAPAAFPGRNGVIVFSSTTGENVTPQLYSITPAGKGRRDLTRRPFSDVLAENLDGSWSPDGRRIAFIRQFSNANPDHGLVVMNADGSGKRVIAPSGRSPVWSPDGTLLAYMAGYNTLRVVHPDGREERAFDSPGLSPSGGPSWAPDGGRLVAETGFGRLTIFDLADGTKRDIVKAGVDEFSRPMWSPDGSSIAYVTGYGDFRAVRVIRPDGSGERVLAKGTRVAWSPDGSRLAVVGVDEGHGEVVKRLLSIFRADGGGVVTLSRRALDTAPTWSPDGHRLAFVEGRLVQVGTEGRPPSPEYDTGTDIYVANADGNGRRRVTHEPAPSEVTQPAWSPDGQHILYSASFDYNDLELYALGPGSRQPRALTHNNVNDYDPAWSPDGTRLAFVRAPTTAHPGPGQIFAADARFRHLRALTPKGYYAGPTWSPDSGFIAFARYVRKQHASYVFVMRRDGSGVRRLTPGSAPVWSPDGHRIAVTDGDTIFVMRTDGSHRKPIASYQEVLRFLDAPIGVGLAGPVWSPDGKQIAFVAGTSDDNERPLRDFTTVLSVQPDGSHMRVLYGPVEEFLTVDWSPDGHELLLCGLHVQVRPITGGPATDLTPALARECNTASWQPR